MSFLAAKNSDQLVENLIIEDDAEAFETLYEHRDEIEAEFGTALNWEGPTEMRSGRQRSHIKATRDGNIFEQEGQWEEYQEWFIEIGERFHEVFGPRIRAL